MSDGQLADTRHALAELWANDFAIAPVQPLSPEQIAWSVIQATGQGMRQRAAAKAELDKKTPLKPEEQRDAATIAVRAIAMNRSPWEIWKFFRNSCAPLAAARQLT